MQLRKLWKLRKTSSVIWFSSCPPPPPTLCKSWERSREKFLQTFPIIHYRLFASSLTSSLLDRRNDNHPPSSCSDISSKRPRWACGGDAGGASGGERRRAATRGRGPWRGGLLLAAGAAGRGNGRKRVEDVAGMSPGPRGGRPGRPGRAPPDPVTRGGRGYPAAPLVVSGSPPRAALKPLGVGASPRGCLGVPPRGLRGCGPGMCRRNRGRDSLARSRSLSSRPTRPDWSG